VNSAPRRSDGVSNYPSGQERCEFRGHAGRWLHVDIQEEVRASFGASIQFSGSPGDLKTFLADRETPVLLTLTPWLHELEQYMEVVEDAALHLSGKLGVVWVVDKSAYVARLMRRARLLRCWKRGDDVMKWGKDGMKVGSSCYHEGYAMYYWNGSIVEDSDHVQPPCASYAPLEVHPSKIPQARLTMQGDNHQLMIMLGHVGTTTVKILLDSGASHDFIECKASQ